MKNAKRCLAILLAVTLLCSNGVSQLGTIVSASELETTEEAQPKEDAVVEQAEETKEDTGKATVEGVTPEEERGESSAQDAETANVPKAAAQEGQNEANVPEAAPATVAPTTVAPTTATPATVTPATAVPASEGAGDNKEKLQHQRCRHIMLRSINQNWTEARLKPGVLITIRLM